MPKYIKKGNNIIIEDESIDIKLYFCLDLSTEKNLSSVLSYTIDRKYHDVICYHFNYIGTHREEFK